MYNLMALGCLTQFPILWSHKGERNGNEVMKAVSYSNNIYYLTEDYTEMFVYQSTIKTLFRKTCTLNFTTMQFERNELLDLEEDFLNSVKEVSPTLQEKWNREKESAHIALGHMANDKMVYGAQNDLFPGLKYSNESLIRGKLPKPCWGCLLGRMKKSPRGSVTYMTGILSIKYHVIGTTKSYDGNTGYFLFKDYMSDFIYIQSLILSGRRH